MLIRDRIPPRRWDVFSLTSPLPRCIWHRRARGPVVLPATRSSPCAPRLTTSTIGSSTCLVSSTEGGDQAKKLEIQCRPLRPMLSSRSPESTDSILAHCGDPASLLDLPVRKLRAMESQTVQKRRFCGRACRLTTRSKPAGGAWVRHRPSLSGPGAGAGT